MRAAWVGVAVLLSGCAGLGGQGASSPMTSVTGAPDALETNGIMVHSAGSGASISSDEEGGGTGTQSGSSLGAGGIGGGIPQ